MPEWIVTKSQVKVSKGVTTASVEFLLIIDELSDNTVSMLADQVIEQFLDVLPFEGTQYPLRPWITCREFECEQLRGRIYSYKANYSNENSPEEEEDNGQDDPLLEPAKVKPTAATLTEATHQDRDGKAFLNTAGDPLIDEVTWNYGGFRISKNVASVPASFLALANTTNNASFTVKSQVIPLNAARFIIPSDWLSDLKWRNGVPYYVFTFELDIDSRNLHYGVKMNAGTRQLKDGKKVAITGNDGSEVSEPVPLDDDGLELADPTPENVIYQKNKRYEEANYSGLPGVNE
jgi:hypothetical protein